MTRFRTLGAHTLRGFAMGSADIVPGVSGGTIALVLGIYERLVGAARDGARALAALVRLDMPAARRDLGGVEWGLVLPVLAGIGAAILVLAELLTGLLAEEPVLMSAVFFGLVLGSVGVTVRDVRRWDPPRLTVGLVVALATFLLLGLRGAPVSEPSLPEVFGAALVAICGMVLPGVSGAFILLMVGMYEPTLGAVSERDAVYLAVFATGAIAGLASFAALLKWLLERHHDIALAALIGLMAGSLRVLWMWPGDAVGDPRLGAPVPEQVPGVVAAATVAAVLVYVLGLVGRPSEERVATSVR